MIDKNRMCKMLLGAASIWKKEADTLSAIDAKFGDGDHGFTMTKIANAFEEEIAKGENKSIKEILTIIGARGSSIGGGAAGPLWGVFIGGLAIPIESENIDAKTLKKMLSSALSELEGISNAKVGDKTMMDVLIPVVEETSKTKDDIDEILKAAYQAALEGVENTKKYSAKFGRAKNYKEQSIGTPDCGAISMSLFFKSLFEN